VGGAHPLERRMATAHHRVAILGAGFSGLCVGARLKQHGHDDFAIFEKAEELGGTWRENTYPGVACDVPSHLYSFSFDLNPEWTRVPGFSTHARRHHAAGMFER
jgi:cation diffusion facilitator CzcD-associated flavoprotein CzcO